jgi:hypothetical protein
MKRIVQFAQTNKLNGILEFHFVFCFFLKPLEEKLINIFDNFSQV